VLGSTFGTASSETALAIVSWRDGAAVDVGDWTDMSVLFREIPSFFRPAVLRDFERFLSRIYEVKATQRAGSSDV